MRRRLLFLLLTSAIATSCSEPQAGTESAPLSPLLPAESGESPPDSPPEPPPVPEPKGLRLVPSAADIASSSDPLRPRQRTADERQPQLLAWGVSQDEAHTLLGDTPQSLAEAREKGIAGHLSCAPNPDICYVDDWQPDFGTDSLLVSPVLYFSREGFFAYKIIFEPNAFDTIAATVSKSVGEPTEASQSTLQNAFGATFPQDEQHWALPSVDILVVRRSLETPKVEKLGLISRKLIDAIRRGTIEGLDTDPDTFSVGAMTVMHRPLAPPRTKTEPHAPF